ncbi:hypothetical protein FI667_g16361, partial [Globisporangium splendens]
MAAPLSVFTNVNNNNTQHNGSLPGNVSPRTPRRESRDAPRGMLSKQPRATMRGVTGPVYPGGAAASGAAATTAPPPTAPSSSTPGDQQATKTASTTRPRSRGWNLIKKDVLPNPLLMQISERVQLIITALHKPPEDRTESDVKLLYTWLMNQEKLSSLFTTMPEISGKKLCKEMEFRHLKDLGPINYGAKVVTLTPGATFGELCLIEPDSKRSATVIVDPQAQIANFIVLTAASYLRMTRSQTIEQYIIRKGTEADSFFVILRGEAQECIKLTLNESAEMSMGEKRGVQHCITVELTFLGKFDIAGEYLAAEKKAMLCPTDIRAMTDVDCLVLSRKLFVLHFGGKGVKKHCARALKRIRAIAEARDAWRETRINQALMYPNLRVPITRKLMRLSENSCVICGRQTYVAGDELCMDLAIYFMRDEKLKKRERKQVERSMSRHRISITPGALSPAKPASTPSGEDSRKKSRKPSTALLPSLNGDDDDSEGPESARASEGRLGTQLVKKHWTVAEKGGLHLPMRPSSSITCAQISSSQMTPLTISSRLSLVTPITRSFHVSQRKLKPKKSIEERIKKIRESWPYQWHEDDDDGDGALTENERETLHTKRCTTFSRSRSPSRCDADSFGGRARCRPEPSRYLRKAT